MRESCLSSNNPKTLSCDKILLDSFTSAIVGLHGLNLPNAVESHKFALRSEFAGDSNPALGDMTWSVFYSTTKHFSHKIRATALLYRVEKSKAFCESSNMSQRQVLDVGDDASQESSDFRTLVFSL